MLAIAVQGVRSGKVQRLVGNVNDRFDDDHDGNAPDDMSRDAMRAAKKGGAAVAGAAKSVAKNEKVRSTASKAATKTRSVATKATGAAKKKLKKLFGRWG